MDAQELQQHKTDGHMDIDAVRAGAMLVCPVKVPGGGVYLGDMHALQGDGEIAGHTADVSGTVTLQVEVLKGLAIDGPVLFPVAEDLPFLARPLSAAEREQALALARRHGLDRARGVAADLAWSAPARTSTRPPTTASRGPPSCSASRCPRSSTGPRSPGAIEIGRHPGVVQVTFRAPVERLAARGLLGYARSSTGPSEPSDVMARMECSGVA